MINDAFLPFFIILLAGLFLSSLFNRLHLPWVAAFLVAGFLVGPYGLDLFEITSPIAFIGDIGLVFLMFMAGLQARTPGFRHGLVPKIATLTILTTTLPFATGFAIASLFGYSFATSLLLGIVFISSSIAVVVPTLQAYDLIEREIGKVIVLATVIADVLSLVLISILLQTADTITNIPLPLFYLLLAASLVVLRFFIPRVHTWLRHLSPKKDVFEREIRLVIVIMLGTVVLFQALGLHSIIAGFFAGFVLADTVKSHILRDKLHALAFGIFIPTLFVVVGAQTNLSLLFGLSQTFVLGIAVIIGSVLSKIASGYIAGRITGFGSKGGLLMGFATVPQLSTTLAAIFAGLSVGLIDEQILAAMVLLTIVTTLLAPLLLNLIHKPFTK